MTKLAPGSFRTSDTVIRSPARYRWTTAPASHSDQGRNFESTLFAELCKSLEVAKTRTTPYRPSANGQMERYNRTLLAAIRCFVDEQQEWDDLQNP